MDCLHPGYRTEKKPEKLSTCSFSIFWPWSENHHGGYSEKECSKSEKGSWEEAHAEVEWNQANQRIQKRTVYSEKRRGKDSNYKICSSIRYSSEIENCERAKSQINEEKGD